MFIDTSHNMVRNYFKKSETCVRWKMTGFDTWKIWNGNIINEQIDRKLKKITRDNNFDLTVSI